MLDTSVRIPTFLPFPGAVKALAESLAVCALFTVTSCVSRGVEHTSIGPPAGPLRLTPTGAPIQTAPILAAADAPTADGGTPNHAPQRLVHDPNTLALTFEAPYPSDARPRAASALQGAADDEELARWNIGGTADPRYVSSQASFHPGTRVVVDAHFPGQRETPPRKSKANAPGLTADRIQAQARSKGYWPFRLCFEAGQREKEGLGGETRIRFTIGARGNVSAARLISSELKNRASSACLVSELRKLHFTPHPRRHTDVVTSIRIWPGDAELPPASDTLPISVDTTSGFDPDAVLARVAAKQSEIEACFSEARRAEPSLWGRLALGIVLEVDGSVHRVSEVESHFPNADAARCAAAAVSKIAFPSVNGKPFSLVVAMRLAPAITTPQGESTDDVAPTGIVEPASPLDNEDAGAGRLERLRRRSRTIETEWHGDPMEMGS